MKQKHLLATVAVLSVCGLAASAMACTGITIRAADGSVVHARSLEWGGVDLKSQATIVPRGTEYVGWAYSSAPTQDNAGKQWTGRYGAIGMNMLGTRLLMDGVNEKGLACGTFLLPGFTEYQRVTPENQAKAIAAGQFNTWVLTQFESVEQLRRSLDQIVVGPAVPAGWQGDMPLHWIASDMNESIVVESIGGKLVVFDAPLGVITNAPNYDWHMTNLRNWVNLRAENVQKAQIGGVQLTPLGEGSGMHGLPGDITPASRFVRAALLSQYALEPKDAHEAVLTAVRVMNAFAINKGYVRAGADGQTAYEYTNWDTFADLANRRYYYRTYDDPSLRVIDMNQINLEAGSVQTVPNQAFAGIDVSGDAQPARPTP